MGTPTQVCAWPCPNFSAPAGRPFGCVSDIYLLISGDAKVCQIKVALAVLITGASQSRQYGKSRTGISDKLPTAETCLMLALAKDFHASL
ncbi:hypothetical protein Tco_1367954 [Tanacetum coccineum]